MIVVQLHVRPDGIHISSMVEGAPPGTAAPDDMVKGVLLQAWEVMLVKGIRAAIEAEQRVKIIDADSLPPNGRMV